MQVPGSKVQNTLTFAKYIMPGLGTKCLGLPLRSSIPLANTLHNIKFCCLDLFRHHEWDVPVMASPDSKP